jgi:hypothetical protein
LSAGDAGFFGLSRGLPVRRPVTLFEGAQTILGMSWAPLIVL